MFQAIAHHLHLALSTIILRPSDVTERNAIFQTNAQASPVCKVSAHQIQLAIQIQSQVLISVRALNVCLILSAPFSVTPDFSASMENAANDTTA